MIIEDDLMEALADIANNADKLYGYVGTYGFDCNDYQFYDLTRELEEALANFRNLVIEVTFKDAGNN